MVQSPRETYFPTVSDSFSAQYNEHWVRVNNESNPPYLLKSANLALFRRGGTEALECFNLHCEPTFAASEETYKAETEFTRRRKLFLERQEIYKKLHMHIPEAKDPISHAHLALFPGQEDIFLSSLDKLDSTLSNLFQMVRNELMEVEFCNLNNLDTETA